MDVGMKPTTLAERVYVMVAAEDLRAQDTVAKPFCRGDELPSEYERDLLDWGMTFGMAFALARLECACESNRSVAKRALDASKSVWAEWAGGVHTIQRPEAFAALEKVTAAEAEVHAA